MLSYVRAARHADSRHAEKVVAMNRAYQEWRNGRSEWDIFNERGELLQTVTNEDDLRLAAVIDSTAGEFVKCTVHRTEEPRFLVRDESGRGWATECLYTSFTADEREYREDEEDEHCQTFGEWLDTCDAGDEFDNSDSIFTVIRIN